MPKTIETDEFSVILACDPETTATIEDIRSTLEPSPYYDSIPHLTLLRGITTPKTMSDDELIVQVEQMLNIQELIGLEISIKGIANRFNHIYKSTSVILVKIPNDLTRIRKNFIAQLQAQHYKIELIERLLYIPHITIRLGIPIRGARKQAIRENIQSKSAVTIQSLRILRIMYVDGKRTSRAIELRHSLSNRG